ncbi:MAG: hypothetical protein WAO58_10410 [Fimbriimonadaceae bacterium]
MSWRDSERANEWLQCILGFGGAAIFGVWGVSGIRTQYIANRRGGDFTGDDAVLMGWFMVAVAIGLLVFAFVKLAAALRRD